MINALGGELMADSFDTVTSNESKELIGLNLHEEGGLYTLYTNKQYYKMSLFIVRLSA